MNGRGPQPWGPWVLALGALAVGLIAIARRAVRTVRAHFLEPDR